MRQRADNEIVGSVLYSLLTTHALLNFNNSVIQDI